MVEEGLCEACHEHDSEEMGPVFKQRRRLRQESTPASTRPAHSN
jgi:hypothetical protein